MPPLFGLFFSVTGSGAGGDHEQARFWEYRSVGVHDMLFASLFSYQSCWYLYSFIIVAKTEVIGFHVGWYALWRRAVWRHCVVFRSTSQMLWCPSNSRRWLLYTSDSVMHSIVWSHSSYMTLCFVVLFLHADAECQFLVIVPCIFVQGGKFI